jgi:hypothetical protein
VKEIMYNTAQSISSRGKLTPLEKKVKQMNWFRRKFLEWSRKAWEDYHEDVKEVPCVNSKSSIRFTIYPASGGYVIEHYKQDRYKDGEGPELTIVKHGDDLGKNIDYIITKEALRS